MQFHKIMEKMFSLPLTCSNEEMKTRERRENEQETRKKHRLKRMNEK